MKIRDIIATTIYAVVLLVIVLFAVPAAEAKPAPISPPERGSGLATLPFQVKMQSDLRPLQSVVFHRYECGELMYSLLVTAAQAVMDGGNIVELEPKWVKGPPDFIKLHRDIIVEVNAQHPIIISKLSCGEPL